MIIICPYLRNPWHELHCLHRSGSVPHEQGSGTKSSQGLQPTDSAWSGKGTMSAASALSQLINTSKKVLGLRSGSGSKPSSSGQLSSASSSKPEQAVGSQPGQAGSPGQPLSPKWRPSRPGDALSLAAELSAGPEATS